MYQIKNENNEVMAEGFSSKKEAKDYRDIHFPEVTVYVCRSTNHPLGPSDIPEKAKPKFVMQNDEPAPVELDKEGNPVEVKTVFTDEELDALADAYPAIGTMNGTVPIWKS